MRRECRERFPRHRLQRKPLVSDPGMHHGTCVTHGGVSNPWCWGKRSRHSRRMRNPQFYVSGKRPVALHCQVMPHWWRHMMSNILVNTDSGNGSLNPQERPPVKFESKYKTFLEQNVLAVCRMSAILLTPRCIIMRLTIKVTVHVNRMRR